MGLLFMGNGVMNKVWIRFRSKVLITIQERQNKFVMNIATISIPIGRYPGRIRVYKLKWGHFDLKTSLDPAPLFLLNFSFANSLE